MNPTARPGRAFPIGASVVADGVNFCLFSRTAEAVELLLFDREDAAEPSQVFSLSAAIHRTYYYWHVHVEGIGHGQLYGYRVHGPNAPERGLRFDPAKLLLDPYTLAVANLSQYSRQDASQPGGNLSTALKSVVVDMSLYDWQGDEPAPHPRTDGVIYEMHVRGFTASETSGVQPGLRGTYAGLIEKIPYLKALGIHSVELMPVQMFDPQAAPTLTNYWGYQPVGWFAPHPAYSAQTSPIGALDEFRDMVRALHQADIEVILDVVFNHTAEVGVDGPTLSLRGIDNPTYYLLDAGAPERYIDVTGCGNTINGNETIVRRMILDCLRHWVQHLHVDGFRFDLASVLSRGEDGEPMPQPPLLWDIETDPVLSSTRIIAEAWDAAGLYQVSSFVGERWAVWNGQYRDTVRRFVKSDGGIVSRLADGIMGSAGMYVTPGRDPGRSVNFIVAHDGFTLNDLVTYNDKHNEANGEHNQDGSNDNMSWNCGVEGPTTDPVIAALRRRQIRNFLVVLLTSQGRPMILMGDEIRRTQGGNNNAYAQDNPISWFDWSLAPAENDLLRFTRELIAYRANSPIFADDTFWSAPGGADVVWHGTTLLQPDYGDSSRSLAYELFEPESESHLHVMLNAYWEPLTFELPALPQNQCWRRLVDTALDAPDDFSSPPQALDTEAQAYVVAARSSAILVAVSTG